MPPTRRVVKACARCRRRKAKCDGKYPKCGACASASVECTGYDSLAGTLKPRSEVADLESRIQQLESRLEAVKSTNGALPDDPFGIQDALDDLQCSLADVDHESHAGVKWSEHVHHRSRTGASGPAPSSHDFAFFERLLLSPAPFLAIINTTPVITKSRSDATNITAAAVDLAAEKRGRPLKSVPEDVVGILLKNYKDTYLAQYSFWTKTSSIDLLRGSQAQILPRHHILIISV
ncbi:hypothetical protein LTS17_000351 [Exophiala oligosperma]